MEKKFEYTRKRLIKSFLPFMMMLGSIGVFGQTIDDFCNCERGFPTLTPSGAYENGVILASKFFTFLPPAARRVVSNRCFVIDKPFVFDEPVLRRFANCNFTMMPGASIIIPEGKPGIHFRGGSFDGCEGEYWTGIQVQKHAFIDLEGTRIGRARAGVQVQDSARLNIRGTVFENNSIGIDVIPGAAPLGTPIFGNTFKNGQVGINNMGLLYIGASSSSNFFGPNLDAGVIGTNGITNIKNSVFEECYVGIITNNSTSIDMNGNRFNKCAYGIQDVNSNITIEENVFTEIQNTAIQLVGHVSKSLNIHFNTIDGWYGIEGTQIFSDDFNVSYNSITAKGNFYSGITMTGIYTDGGYVEKNSVFGTDDVLDGAAILLNGCNGLRVSENYIELRTGKASGISIVGSQNCLVNRNAVKGTRQQVGSTIENSQIDLQCNEFFDQANGILVKGFSLSDISTNFIGNSEVGLFYQKSAISGTQEHNGNLWNGNTNTIGAFHGSSDRNFYNLSSFKVASDEAPIHPGTVFPIEWFETETGKITKECDSGNRPSNDIKTGKAEAPNQSLYNQIGNEQLYSQIEDAGLQYEAEKYLLKKIEKEPAFESAVNFQSQKIARLQGFNAVQNGIENLVDFQSANYIDYLASNQEIKNLNFLIEKINDEIELASDSEQSNLLPQRNELMAELSFATQQNQKFWSIIKAEFDIKVDIVQNDLNKLSTENSFERNEEFVQQLFLKSLLGQVEKISNTDIERLKKLADANPNAEGNAVYKARTILARLESKTALDFEISTTDFELSSTPSKQISQELNLEIFPNPTSDILFVELPQVDLKNTSATIYDLTGNRILSQSMKEQIFNVSSLAEGFYFLKVYQGEKLIGVEKISVIR